MLYDSEHRQNHSFNVTANYEGESLVKFWRDGTSPAQISVDLATTRVPAAMKSAKCPKCIRKARPKYLRQVQRLLIM